MFDPVRDFTWLEGDPPKDEQGPILAILGTSDGKVVDIRILTRGRCSWDKWGGLEVRHKILFWSVLPFTIKDLVQNSQQEWDEDTWGKRYWGI